MSWINGQVVDTDALAATGLPILLDGAQGLGAIPVDPVLSISSLEMTRR